MKYKNVKLKFGAFNLQLFAEDGGEGSDGGETGGDDPDGEEDPDEDGEEEEEKKFSQKDIEEAVKKRLAREKRKWQREQRKQPEKPDSGDNAGTDDEETQKLKEKAAKAEEMELKWTCLEHDVDKSCVDDVLALAKVHMAKDEDLDIEDAIDKVLKKYPQFKASASKDEEEEETRGKSWGERQKGRTKGLSGVESRFYELNPDLKK